MQISLCVFIRKFEMDIKKRIGRTLTRCGPKHLLLWRVALGSHINLLMSGTRATYPGVR